MTKKLSIQFRACFLLAVFSINIVVGFACAIGVNMSSNNAPHSEIGAPRQAAYSHDGHHSRQPGHHDDNVKGGSHTSHHGDSAGSNKGADDDECCSDDVAKHLLKEKSITKSITLDHPVLSYFYSAHFYRIEESFNNRVNRHTRYFVRNYHPPISNIRIAIQRFQI